MTGIADSRDAGTCLLSRGQRVLVIGAGPSGLVAAKYLLESEFGLKVVVYEQGSTIGGTFSNKTYDDTTLVSSKYITLFADLRCPASTPEHMTSVSYVEYLQRYCDEFSLWPHLHFGRTVTQIRKRASDSSYLVAHIVGSDDGSGRQVEEVFDHVVVCSGLHNVPNEVQIDGLDTFPGRVLHSSKYKEPSIFRRKRVLIIGSGETAMDLAYRAVKQEGSQVSLSSRHGFLSVPAVMDNGKPLDIFISNLFEHAYEHPWVHALQLKWKASTWVIRVGFLLATGSSWGWNQWACPVKEVRRGYHIINKSGAAMPYITRAHKRKSRVGSWLFGWLDEGDEGVSRDKAIATHPGVARVHGSEITFRDGTREEADVIVMCTGYRQQFPFLAPRGTQLSCGANEDALPSWHHIIDPLEPRMAFIGFVRPNVGAIPPIAEMQVMWWLRVLAGDVRRPLGTPSYHVLGRKYAYGVDYGNYMFRLAEEMGARPCLGAMLRRSWRTCFAFCMGQAMTPFFKLQGPYASEEAWRVCRQGMGPTYVRTPSRTHRRITRHTPASRRCESDWSS